MMLSSSPRYFFTGHLHRLTSHLRTLSLTTSSHTCTSPQLMMRTFNTTTTATATTPTRLLSSCISHHQPQISSIQRYANCQHEIPVRSLHTSLPCFDLGEFFEDKSNWAKEKISTGRPWLLGELRLKSNEDLHKLWYILLKERNMLMTTEAEYKRQAELFPNPERLFKVDESMQNILEIVAERDDAYSLLETGKSSRPQYKMVRNFLGLKYKRRLREHAVPHYMNRRYRMMHTPFTKGMGRYFKLYYEKQRMLEKRREKRKAEYQKRLQKTFPHLQLEEGEENKQSI